ncbi:leucine-rich repeat domain, L domain-like protein [Artemisia annua]|uniref:Leucine-rich repeat domain, L domain-like protein n=1 Tax=Artemisia annua TaxID=35608 RepID=A0A2U1M5I5_ARTAN|nr:leucine-rich repeat domain, L domain-like protein [Artemisia annua]
MLPRESPQRNQKLEERKKEIKADKSKKSLTTQHSLIKTTTHPLTHSNYSLHFKFISYLHNPKKKKPKNQMPQISYSYSYILVLIFLNLCINTISITHWEDIQSLKHFKLGINPNSVSPGSCISTWDFSFDPCDTLSTERFTCGIRCDVAFSNVSRVTDLTLDRAGYSGSLTPNLNLPYLTTLDLTNNYFTGSIHPGSFSKLTRLTRLSLSSNSFNESIPDSVNSFPDSLEELYLDNNNLHGPVPHSLNTLKNLKRLELQNNQLSNSLPELTQLANLSFLDVSNNLISGELPASFPANIIQLTMRNNTLQGNIPANLLKDSVYLQVLDLSYNNLTGILPQELFTHPSLQQLTLSNNFFKWVPSFAEFGSAKDRKGKNVNKRVKKEGSLFSLPRESKKLNKRVNEGGSLFSLPSESELIAIDLSNNDLHGYLPVFMGYMPKLSALSLENNKFSGVIPVQYAVKAVMDMGGSGGAGELAPFERLLLGGNYLFGLIPGPLLRLRTGSDVMIELGDNCLYECPVSFYFCGGGSQKSLMECKTFSPVIP